MRSRSRTVRIRATLFAALMGSAWSLAAAPSSASQEMDPRCHNKAFAEKCAASCGSWCKTDRKYFLSQKEFCVSEAVFSNNAENTDPICDSDDTSLESDLLVCLEKERHSGRPLEDKLKEIQNAPALVEKMKAFLDGIPECAPDAPTLLKLFKCAEIEGAGITSEFKQLSEQGYSRLAEISKLCEIPRDNMTNDLKLANTLKVRAEQLQREFSSLKTCKNDYEAWASAAAEEGKQKAFGALLQQWIEKTGKDLEPAEKMALSLDSQLHDIKSQMDSIVESVQIGLVLCP